MRYANWRGPGNWRAACGESRKHGSERGGRKRIGNNTSLAAYSTLRAMDLLGQPIYLAGKPKGDKSMSEKQVSTKVCSVVRPASPVRMVKPELDEPKFPVVYSMPTAAYLTR